MSKRQLGSKICQPNRLVWPKISDEDEKEIVEKLKRIFKRYRECMRRNVTKGPQKSQLSEKEIQERKSFRSTFVIGFNAVIRKLEQKKLHVVLMDRPANPGFNAVIRKLEQKKLHVVLMDRSANPGVLKRAILTMAVENRCPALLVADLLPAIHESWPGLKSCMCLGVMKASSKNDFDELVSFIQQKKLIDIEGPNIPSKILDETNTLTQEKNKENIKESVSHSETKPRANPTRPTVDFTKYYIPAKEKPAERFEGQSFIQIGDETENEIIVFKNGKRMTDELNKDIESYGIHPMFVGKLRFEELTKGVKRKLSNSAAVRSDYKRINIQQLKPNESKIKKVKKNKTNQSRYKNKGKTKQT